MDVHRKFAEIAIVENGLCRDEGWIGVTPETLRVWAETLEPDSEVALEATRSSDARRTTARTPVSCRHSSGPTYRPCRTTSCSYRRSGNPSVEIETAVC